MTTMTTTPTRAHDAHRGRKVSQVYLAVLTKLSGKCTGRACARRLRRRRQGAHALALHDCGAAAAAAAPSSSCSSASATVSAASSPSSVQCSGYRTLSTCVGWGGGAGTIFQNWVGLSWVHVGSMARSTRARSTLAHPEAPRRWAGGSGGSGGSGGCCCSACC